MYILLIATLYPPLFLFALVRRRLIKVGTALKLADSAVLLQ